jgi:hypothetical protein
VTSLLQDMSLQAELSFLFYPERGAQGAEIDARTCGDYNALVILAGQAQMINRELEHGAHRVDEWLAALQHVLADRRADYCTHPGHAPCWISSHLPALLVVSESWEALRDYPQGAQF